MRDARRVVVAIAVSALVVLAVPVLTVSSGGATGPDLGPAPSCRPSQMRVATGRPQGAAGTSYYPIIFTNVGGACAIWGVPHLQPVAGAAHRAVGPAASNASIGMMPVRHVLGRGQAVSVGFGVGDTGNYPVARCRARVASGVVVSLAPFVRATYVGLRFSTCTALASTRTALIVAGRTGA